MKTNLVRPVPTLAPLLFLAAISALPAASIEKAAPLAALGTLPIKEVTVFKDGYAFVAQEGLLPTDRDGNVMMDCLPSPVLGTFWPYCANPRAKLTGVVASQRRIQVEHTALSLRELIEANIGAEAIITETGLSPYSATILDIPRRSAEELAATSPPGTPEHLPQTGEVALLKTDEGVKVVNLDRIEQVTFKKPPNRSGGAEEFRDLLTLKLDWGGSKPEKAARVGLFYLQKGVRWIPNYKVEIDGKGHATVKLQATLLNELADLDDVSLNLVVGVPTFAFKDTLDPMALQHDLAQLSPYFQNNNSYRNSPIASQFSNALMTQTPRMGEYRAAPPAGGSSSLGPDIADSGRSEDLFVFRMEHITLRRGERMVLPVAEFVLPYRDVYTLDLPFAPPPELRGNLNTDQQRELARLLGAPKVMHKIRFTNTSQYPLTTAPALIIREGRVMAQGMMTYTSTGASDDLAITAAIDIQTTKSDVETKRMPDALRQGGSSYARVDLSGKITLTNHRGRVAELEITRYVLGAIDSADHDGKVEAVNLFENADHLGSGDYPFWWGWYSWPYWWSHCNGIGRVAWKLQIDPGQNVELGYNWHYFWR